ncbi:MAG: hypothetical protein RI575_12840 [Balneolaceae bacterium]|nr:hypothetical protein [Balneolaceae bacterium]
MIRYLFFCAISILFALPAHAQIYNTQYRVPGQEWMELNTDHFRLIYPQRYEQEAYRSLAILESEYADIKDLVGGEMDRFPFILNPENDNSNGFVSPINFRSEVELSPIISKSMNPKSGDWLEIVLPHELVHAMHFNYNPESFTRVLSVFSPDIRRGTHTAAPNGFLEGIAVEYESHNQIPQSGRGNYPYFRNKFRSVLNTGDEWSMGQLIHSTTYTPPFDRHYIGGYEFVNWLLDSYGEDSMKNAIEYHYKYPFLGFGMALKHETDSWPGELYDQFSKEKKQNETDRLKEIGNGTDSLSKEIPFSATCKRLQRPKWLDEDTLIFFGRGCNRTTGFYTYDLIGNSLDLLKEVSITDDFFYSLSEDKSSLIYSRYHSHLLYDNLFQGDLHQLDFNTGRSVRITRSARLFSPALFDDDILAVQTSANEMNLVRINPNDGEILQEYSKPEHSTVVQAAPNPYQPGTAAIIGRINSTQAIWFEDLDLVSILDSDPEIVFENGSIFDLAWHPKEEKLLFVSDHTGTMNLYEYDVPGEIVNQITDSQFNAFEASYSPGGEQVAYIMQDEHEQTLQLLNLSDAVWQQVPADLWKMDKEITESFSRPLMNREENPDRSSWKAERYSTGWGWLKPRLWLPTYEDQDGYHRPGLTFESGDVMSSQAYSLDASYMAERLWYDASYIYKGFYPGFEVSLFNEPFIASFKTDNEDDDSTQELLQDSRGASFSVPIPLTIESNTRFTSLYFEPSYSVSQVRFLDPDRSSRPVSEFATRHTIGLQTIFNWNIRQFIRDVQPNAGWAFFAEWRQALNKDEIMIETDQLSVDGTLSRRYGVNAGVITFLSPLKRWNQSLRISAEVYSQTEVPVFGISSDFADHFSEFPFPGANNIGFLNTRYTIPLVYPDEGGLLLPLYMSNIYLVLFSQTATNLDYTIRTSNTRTLYGAGIRSRFRLSNLSFDIGISIGWEPTRDNLSYHFGYF